jgi:predicted acetyltransferase
VVTLRPLDQREMAATEALLVRAYGWSPDGPEIHAWRRAHRNDDLSTTLCAVQSGVLIGFVEYTPVSIQVGDHGVAGAIAANLAVDPDWRRRRVATRLMDRQLEQLHDNGIAILAGAVAQVSLMRTLGWEFGSTVLRYDLPTGELSDQLPATPLSGHAEPLSVRNLPDVAMVYRRSVTGRFGAFARTRSWWAHRILNDAAGRRDRELIGWTRTGKQLESYAVIEPHKHSTRIVELHALTHDAYVGLLRHLACFHDECRVRWSAPVDDPLPLVASQPYRLRPHLEPDKMFRVVDADAVLRAAIQSNRSDTVLTVAVRDDRAPWNARTWRIGRDHDGTVGMVPIDTTPDAVIPVSTLAATIGGLPTAPRETGGVTRPGDDTSATLTDLVSPRRPAYCREDI